MGSAHADGAAPRPSMVGESGSEPVACAPIYGFSRDGESRSTGSARYVADRCGIARGDAIDAPRSPWAVGGNALRRYRSGRHGKSAPRASRFDGIIIWAIGSSFRDGIAFRPMRAWNIKTPLQLLPARGFWFWGKNERAARTQRLSGEMREVPLNGACGMDAMPMPDMIGAAGDLPKLAAGSRRGPCETLMRRSVESGISEISLQDM